jgi:hypothetical protein
VDEQQQAEEEILISSGTKELFAPDGSLAKRIIDDLVVKNKPRPWVGPLPAPRKSPLRMIGDVISNAKVFSSASCKKRPPRLAWLSSSQWLSIASDLVPNPRSGDHGSGCNLGAGSAWPCGGLNSNSNPNLNQKPIKKQTCGPTRKRPAMCPGPNISYRPTPGLVGTEHYRWEP